MARQADTFIRQKRAEPNALAVRPRRAAAGPAVLWELPAAAAGMAAKRDPRNAKNNMDLRSMGKRETDFPRFFAQFRHIFSHFEKIFQSAGDKFLRDIHGILF